MLIYLFILFFYVGIFYLATQKKTVSNTYCNIQSSLQTTKSELEDQQERTGFCIFKNNLSFSLSSFLHHLCCSASRFGCSSDGSRSRGLSSLIVFILKYYLLVSDERLKRSSFSAPVRLWLSNTVLRSVFCFIAIIPAHAIVFFI
jgi:hypothetical protein